MNQINWFIVGGLFRSCFPGISKCMHISLNAGGVPFLSSEEDPPVVGIIGEISLFPGLDFPAALTDASFKA